MINEDMNQVMGDLKAEIFRDLRVCSLAYVVRVHDKQVDVQLTVADMVGGTAVTPPEVRNLFVCGSMPSAGALGVVLHFDRKNFISNSIQASGGPAHEIGYGVFLPINT